MAKFNCRMISRSQLLGIAGLVFAVLVSVGCKPEGKGKNDKLLVVTTFTVIADMARNVAGDAAEVVSVTKPGAEIQVANIITLLIVSNAATKRLQKNGYKVGLMGAKLSQFDQVGQAAAKSGDDNVRTRLVPSTE